MSEREGGSGFGPFLLGVSLGALLGFLFAPEPGEAARGRLSRKLRGLRDLAADKAGELGELLEAGRPEREDPPTARAALQRRLVDAKARRRGSRQGGGEGAALPRPAPSIDEEDEPVA